MPGELGNYGLTLHNKDACLCRAFGLNIFSRHCLALFKIIDNPLMYLVYQKGTPDDSRLPKRNFWVLRLLFSSDSCSLQKTLVYINLAHVDCHFVSKFIIVLAFVMMILMA